jgi:hypothetical protein
VVHAVNVLVEKLCVQEAVAPVEDEVLNDEVQQQLATDCLPGNRRQANSVRHRYQALFPVLETLQGNLKLFFVLRIGMET